MADLQAKIITVGLSPCWDKTIFVEGIDWGRHKPISRRTVVPAGKAFNICKALAWLGNKSIAAGLWGAEDYDALMTAAEPLGEFIKIAMTSAAGSTRENITVVDTVRAKEMHLRSASELATADSLGRLRKDLAKVVFSGSVCAFAGAMPAGSLEGDVLAVVQQARRSGAKVVVDTSGEALKAIVNSGGLYVIKPNVAELCELLSEEINDDVISLARAAGKLLDKVDIVLVSRGRAGAVVVSRDVVFSGGYTGPQRATSNTVACGDYLLAGFLCALEQGEKLDAALATGLKVATARAWGLSENISWSQADRQIEVRVSRQNLPDRPEA